MKKLWIVLVVIVIVIGIDILYNMTYNTGSQSAPSLSREAVLHTANTGAGENGNETSVVVDDNQQALSAIDSVGSR